MIASSSHYKQNMFESCHKLTTNKRKVDITNHTFKYRKKDVKYRMKSNTYCITDISYNLLNFAQANVQKSNTFTRKIE